MTPPDRSNNPTNQPRPSTPFADQAAAPRPLALTRQSPAADGQGPSALSTTPTVGELLMALQRRWVLATALAFTAAAIALAAVAVVFPPKYVTQARLELASRQARPFLVGNVGDIETEPATYRANQLAIIKSPLVLNAALNSEKLTGLRIAGQSPEALENALKADFTQGPEIMTVKLSGDSPDNLADVLNAVVAAYIKEVESRDNHRRDLGVSKLEKSLKENQDKLQKLRQQLDKQERDFNIPDPVTQQMMINAVTVAIARLETDLHMAGTDSRKKQFDLTYKKARKQNIAKESVSAGDMKRYFDTNFTLRQFADKIGDIDQEIAKWNALPDSEQRRNALAKLELDKDKLAESAAAKEAALRPNAEKQLRLEMVEKLDLEIVALIESIEQLKIQESSLTTELAGKQNELKKLTSSGRNGILVIDQVRDEIKQTEKTQDTLASQVALQKAEPSAFGKIGVLQTADTPTGKDYSRFIKYGAAGAMGAFGLVMFVVAFLEYRLRKVNGTEEVKLGMGLPIIGTIPRLPANARRPAQASATPRELHWQNIITESVDAIRTQLLHAARHDGVTIVMVTSSSGGEGKTTLASQLAASLARAWRKTLLVDGDLRNPAAHKLFDLPLEPGFSELLRGEAVLRDVVKPTLLSRLWMMPAGHWDAHAVQALAQDDVRTKFQQMKEQYDFVVVDSCPVLPVADALQLGQHVDAVVFSVLRDVSRLPSLQTAQQRLQALGVRVLGAVVIGTEGDPGSLAYKYTSESAT